MTNCILTTARNVLLLGARLSYAVALLGPTTARAQPAEARCGSPSNPLTTYIVRVDCLDTIHAKDAIEVSKDGQICAATVAEARAWQSVLETARDRMRREVQTAAETTKARITAARALWADAEELRRAINQQYADAENNVKDVIKFTTDVVFSEAAFPAAFGSAVRSLVASKTINSDPISFATDAALIIRNGTDVRRKLSELAFAEAGATVAADVIVGQLLGPLRKYVGNVADEARASALRAIDKATADLLTLEVIEAGLTPAFEREITRAKAYAARVTPQLDGTWQSVEPNQRFLLQCSSGRCTWRDAHPDYPAPYSVERIFVCNPGGAYLLERPNDDAALVAQGIQPTLRAEALARRPDPSTLTLSRRGEQLIGHWRALLIIKNANARLKELKYPERDYRFVQK